MAADVSNAPQPAPSLAGPVGDSRPQSCPLLRPPSTVKVSLGTWETYFPTFGTYIDVKKRENSFDPLFMQVHSNMYIKQTAGKHIPFIF